MKIGWITDDVCKTGGRQFTIKNLRDKTPPDVELIDINLNDPEECDLYIIHTPMVPKNLPLFPKTLKPGLAKVRPVIMYAHQWNIMGFGANSIVYQSPLHATQHKFGKSFIIPPAITSEEVVYEGDELEPINANLWLGTFSPETGADIAVRVGEAERVETHFFGWQVPQSNTNFSKLGGEIVHTQIPSLYRRYLRLVYYPRDPQPFGRSIAEALLSGAEVRVSGKLGIESFDKPIQEVLESTFTASEEFWKLVETHL